MHKTLFTVVLMAALASAAAASAGASRASARDVPYPEGYRRWVHVSSQLIGPGSPMHASVGGLHHIYANETAMAGFAQRRFPEGSVFVFDVLNVETSKDVTSETTRRLLNVMVKDSTNFAATGGWGYEEFKGDTRERILEEPRRAQCAQCHATKKEQGFIFSAFRE